MYVGSYPADPFTTYWSPDWENGAAHAAGAYSRVRFRWDEHYRLEIDGLVNVAAFTDGQVAWTMPPTHWPDKDLAVPTRVYDGADLMAATYEVSSTDGTVRIMLSAAAAPPAATGWYERSTFTDGDSRFFDDVASLTFNSTGEAFYELGEDTDDPASMYSALTFLQTGLYLVELNGYVYLSEDALVRSPAKEAMIELGWDIHYAYNPGYIDHMRAPYHVTPATFGILPAYETVDMSYAPKTVAKARMIEFSFHMYWNTSDGGPLRPRIRLRPAADWVGDTDLDARAHMNLTVARITDGFFYPT